MSLAKVANRLIYIVRMISGDRSFKTEHSVNTSVTIGKQDLIPLNN